MNNIPTLRWLVALFACLFVLATERTAAQCTISFIPPQPVTLTLSLSSAGMATLNASTVPSIGTNGGCALVFSPNTSFSPSYSTYDFTCTDVSLSPHTWYVRAENGNPAQTSAVVTLRIFVQDALQPNITCPAGATYSTNLGICTYSYLASDPQPTFSDNCPVGTTVSWVMTGAMSGTGTGLPFTQNMILGPTVVTFTATDAVGNTRTCTQAITIEDNEDPSITCPHMGYQAFPNDLGQCNAVLTFDAVGSDNCNTVDITYDAVGAETFSGMGGTIVDTFDVLGVTTITYTVTDGNGLTSTCSFDVEVEDIEDPVIVCPADMSVNLDAACAYVVNGTGFDPMSFSDNCTTGAGFFLFNDWDGGTTLDGAFFPVVGPLVITWTVEDEYANTGTCAFAVTFLDITPPDVTFGDTTVVSVTSGDCSSVVTFQRPSYEIQGGPAVTDNCTPGAAVTIAQGTPTWSGGTFNLTIPPFDPNQPQASNNAVLQFPVGTTTIPFIWTDDSGNATTRYKVIVVNENLKPTPKCKTGIVNLALDATGMATLTPSMVDDGSFDNCGTVVLSVVSTGATASGVNAIFDCADIGNHTYTLTVSDVAVPANTATCTGTVKVVDGVAPAATCPAPLPVAAGANCETLASSMGSVLSMTARPANAPLTAPGQYRDNCSGTVITYSILNPNATTETGTYPIPGTKSFAKGATNVTYTFVDPSGNNTVCSFTVNVTDQTAPAWSGTGQAAGTTITQSANTGGCLRQVSWTPPTFTDNCPGTVTVTSNRNPGEFFNFGTTNVTYTATDAAGNVTQHTFAIKIEDGQPPVARCKPTYNVQIGATGAPVSVPADSIDNGSTDNCFFSIALAPNTFSCADIGTKVVTLTVTDGNTPANTRTCTSVITIQDNVAPEAVCTAAPLTFAVDANGTATVNAATVNGSSTDNCTASANLAFSISKDGATFEPSVAFNCSETGARTITLRVVDAQSNSATCTKSISIIDNTPPTAVAPANVTVSCEQLPYASMLVSSADNCGVPTVTLLPDAQSNLVCPNSYDLIRTWRVTDASGNTATVSQTISVRDNQAPVFSPLDTIFVETTDPLICDEFVGVELTDNDVADNCSDFAALSLLMTIDYPINSLGYTDISVPVAYDPNLLEFFPLGTTKIVFTAYDACGRSATQPQVVVVKDVQAPIFSGTFAEICGQVFVKTNTPGACSNTHQWARPTNAFPGDESILDCGGGDSVTETFTDQNGAPVNSISVPPFNFFNPTFLSLFPTAQFPVGITHVTYTAKDASGNTASCRFTVEVQDNQPPTLICPQQQTLSATCPSAVVPDYRNLVGVTDNCQGTVALTQAFAAGVRLDSIFKAPNVPAAGKTFNVTMTGTDRYNTSTCTFTVVLADGTAPVPTLASLPMLVDSCGALSIAAPSATDPCNPTATIIYGTPSTPVGTFLGGTPPRYSLVPGNYVITWIYNDGNGNISTQPQNIRVLQDIFPPKAVCKRGMTIDLDATGNGSITAAQIDSGSVDLNRCGVVKLALSKSSFNCANLGLNTVVLTVRDTNNNASTCTSRIVVRDVIKPRFSAAPRDTTINACAAIPAAAVLTAIDVCDTNVPVVFKDSTTQKATGTGKYNFSVIRRWSATDDSGNNITDEQIITVRDTTKPAFLATLPTTITVLTAPNATDCKATARFDAKKFITDCATGTDLRITSNPRGFSNTDTTEVLLFGVTTFQITAKDTSGNIATKAVRFEVKDGTIPTAACINGISVSLQTSGTVSVTTNQVNANSFDNCSPADSLTLRIQRLTTAGAGIGTPTPSIDFGCPDADGKTQHKVKLFVKDKANNESTCETYVVVQDNAPPTIAACPASKTLLCTQSIDPLQNNNGTMTASDNCQGNVAVTFADVTTNGSGASCLTVARTWLAKDGAGNTATCLQTFTISDVVPPTFSSLPADATISCSDPLVTAPTLTATDNCSAAADIKLTFKEVGRDSAAGACGKYSYTVERTWTATDKCGNTATHVQKIKVVDDIAPLFLGLPDTLRFFSANFAANLNCTVPVSLDLSQYLSDCTPDSTLKVTHTLAQSAAGIKIAASLPVGSYPVFLAATDLCNNTRRDTIVLRTIDNSIPTVVCNDNVIISLGSANTATLKIDDIDLGSTDNCGIATRKLVPETFNCSNLGNNVVTMTVTDMNGNSNFCTVTVQVTLGTNAGLTANATATPETAFGAADGTADVTVSNGSGKYAYEWSNGDTTKAISGLPADFYVVKVTDSVTMCFDIDTAVVDPGPMIFIAADSVCGGQDAIINVPITAELFKNIYGVRFNLAVQDTSIGRIVGTANINPALTGLVGNLNSTTNVLGILFAKIDSISLPDGAVLFDVQVRLGKKAPVVSTPLLFSNIEVIQGLGNGPETVSVETLDGVVAICTVANKLEVGGDILTWRAPAKPVPGVTLTLSGSKTGTQTTAVPGTYLFNTFGGDTTIVKPSKTTAGNAQITAADLLLIQNYIFGSPLASPYQWVAADVDGNGMITLLDYVRISTVVLGTNQHIPGAPDWKFIPSTYVFPTPNPLSVKPPDSIRHDNLNISFLDDDFIGVRMGDVNGNISPSLTDDGSGDDRTNEMFRFRLEEQPLKKGQLLRVPFRASDFKDRQAYQLTIQFDPAALSLSDLEMGTLPGLKAENFGTVHLVDGHLTTVWTSTQPVTLPDDAVLFTLVFRVNADGRSLAAALRPGSAVTPAEAYDRSGNTMPIDFEFTQPNGQEAAVFALYQNQPNPFNNTTTVGFRLPEEAHTTVRVFNANGQLVRSFVGDYQKGYNELRFQASDLGANGVYYYEIETPTHSDRKKMVFLNGE